MGIIYSLENIETAFFNYGTDGMEASEQTYQERKASWKLFKKYLESSEVLHVLPSMVYVPLTERPSLWCGECGVQASSSHRVGCSLYNKADRQDLTDEEVHSIIADTPEVPTSPSLDQRVKELFDRECYKRKK